MQLLDRFKVQLIVATHSTTLFSALGLHGGNRVSVTFLSAGRNELRARRFDSEAQNLCAILGGHILMGPLFGAPLLLVEGDDDAQVWTEVPRHRGYEHHMAVVSCGGEPIYKAQKTLETILSSLVTSSPAPAFALLDGDKPPPDGTAQERVPFLQLACRECENLYPTDEVLSVLDHTWDDAVDLIRSSAAEYGAKKTELESCVGRDRKTGDFKPAIQQIAQILDPKHVPWPKRVAQTIGARKPTGQLAEFLGSAVLRALWPN